jgi:hypothetical protein
VKVKEGREGFREWEKVSRLREKNVRMIKREI